MRASRWEFGDPDPTLDGSETPAARLQPRAQTLAELDDETAAMSGKAGAPLRSLTGRGRKEAGDGTLSAPSDRARQQRSVEHEFEEPNFEGMGDEDFLRAVNDGSPYDPVPLADYASYLMQKDAVNRAEFYLGRAIVVTDNNEDLVDEATRARLLRLQALVHLSYQQFGRADACYQRAVAEAPEDVATRLAFGAFLVRIRDLDRAEEQYLRAVVLAAQHPVPLLTYGLFLWHERGLPDKAQHYLVRAAGMARDCGDPSMLARAMRHLAAFLRDERRDYVAARKRLVLAARARPDDAEVFADLGRLALLQQDDEAAAGYFWRTLEIHPAHSGE